MSISISGPRLRSRPGKRNRTWCGLFTLAFGLFFCLTSILAGYFLFTRQPHYELPEVSIIQPTNGAELPAHQKLTILSSAFSLQKIVKQELWVDSKLVYVTNTRQPGGLEEFVGTMLWDPQPGSHTLVTRATDRRGNTNASHAVRITIIQAPTSEMPNTLQITQPGDTLDSIASENAITPDQVLQENPNLQAPPPPGGWVSIPPDNQASLTNDDSPNRIENPLENGGEADSLAIPGEPLNFWDTILQSPAAPTDLNVLPGYCSSILTWTDRSTNESGYYVYRLNPGGRGWMRIAQLAANSVQYIDLSVSGEYQYQIAAFNGLGEFLSNMAQVDIPGNNCFREVSTQVLEVEAESLSVDIPVEEVYCYAALKGNRPFERIPSDQTEFLHRLGPPIPQADFLIGNWNIGEYYSGANKRIVSAPEGGAAFQVEVECWGARMTSEGGEAFSLGSFNQYHPPAEWDGRPLSGRGNQFTLVYHIGPWSGPGGEPNALIDPDIPAPYGLHRARDFSDCSSHSPGDAGSQLGCALISYPDKAPLIWEWDGVSEQIDGFRIYLNRTPAGGSWTAIEDIPKDFQVWVGPSQIPCGETWRYAVSAFDLNVESPLSEFIALSGGECKDLALVEVELSRIWVQYINDGYKCSTPIVCLPGTTDHTAENYGFAWFWRLPRGGGGEMADQKGVNLIGPTQMHGWVYYQGSDLPMCHFSGDLQNCNDPMGRNNNKMIFLVHEGDALGGKVILWDEDLGLVPSGDDIWCHVWFRFPAISLEQWEHIDQTNTEVDGGASGYGDCDVDVRVRGLGRAGSSHVLPPGGGAAPFTNRQADLRIVGIDRNRQGNARLTIYNAGVDTLLDDTITLSFQVGRVESGAGGAPNTIFEHQERASLTVGAFDQTTVDTGQTLLEGYENRVRIVIDAMNFDDPHPENNAFCARVDLPNADQIIVLDCVR